MTDHAVIIRDAVPGDAEAFSKIYNTEIDFFNHYESKPEASEQRRAWIERLLSQRLPVFAAAAQDRVVGFGALTPFHSVSGYRYTVSAQLYVHPDFRGAGVGNALASHMHTAAHQGEVHSILAGVNANNKACLGLLQNFGFQIVGCFKEIAQKNGVWQDDICLQLILNQGENSR